MYWFSFFYLAALLGVQLFLKKKKGELFRLYFVFYAVAVFAVISAYFLLVYFQYVEWSNPAFITRYFVPPYKGWGYVFGYHFSRFLLYYLPAFGASVLFALFLFFANKKRGGIFLESEEPFLAAVSIFILGHRGFAYWWIWYAVFIFAAALVGASIKTLRRGKNNRFSFYWWWLPVAILVIILRGLFNRFL